MQCTPGQSCTSFLWDHQGAGPALCVNNAGPMASAGVTRMELDLWRNCHTYNPSGRLLFQIETPPCYNGNALTYLLPLQWRQRKSEKWLEPGISALLLILTTRRDFLFVLFVLLWHAVRGDSEHCTCVAGVAPSLSGPNPARRVILVMCHVTIIGGWNHSWFRLWLSKISFTSYWRFWDVAKEFIRLDFISSFVS